MESLVILIPIALLFTGVAVAALFWAIKSGQFDDLDRAASDILFDDEPDAPVQTSIQTPLQTPAETPAEPPQKSP